MTGERAIAALLSLDPETRGRLARIDGRVIRLHITEPALEFALAIVDERIDVLRRYDGEVDVTISGSLSALRSLQDGRDALYTGDVRIDGDVGVAQQLSDIANGLDIDLEEIVAPFVGGTLARRLGLFSQDIGRWHERTRAALREDTADYLVEESELLAPADAVASFGSDVDELRSAVDRLEVHVRRTERQRTSTP